MGSESKYNHERLINYLFDLTANGAITAYMASETAPELMDLYQEGLNYYSSNPDPLIGLSFVATVGFGIRTLDHAEEGWQRVRDKLEENPQ